MAPRIETGINFGWMKVEINFVLEILTVLDFSFINKLKQYNPLAKPFVLKPHTFCS